MQVGLVMKNLLQALRKQFELPQYTDELQRQRFRLLVAMLNGGAILALLSLFISLLAVSSLLRHTCRCYWRWASCSFFACGCAAARSS